MQRISRLSRADESLVCIDYSLVTKIVLLSTAPRTEWNMCGSECVVSGSRPAYACWGEVLCNFFIITTRDYKNNYRGLPPQRA